MCGSHCYYIMICFPAVAASTCNMALVVFSVANAIPGNNQLAVLFNVKNTTHHSGINNYPKGLPVVGCQRAGIVCAPCTINSALHARAAVRLELNAIDLQVLHRLQYTTAPLT